MVQDLTDTPSTCTTQAPHWLVSQPTWVPVRPSFSRSSSTSRVRPSTSAVTRRPFTVSDTAGIPLSPSSLVWQEMSLPRQVVKARAFGEAHAEPAVTQS